MSNSRNRAILALIIGFGLFASQASAVERTVDCDKGQSIQDVLDTAPAASSERFTVAINGICKEDVTIRRQMVTIDGNLGPTGPTIEGTVSIFADDVRVQYLTVTGPGRGVVVSQATQVRLVDVNLIQNAEAGLHLRRGAFAWVRGGTISANGGPGVFLENASVDVFRQTVIEGNSEDGILADVGANVTIRPAIIRGNTGNGVSATLHSVIDFKDGAQVYGNGGYGAFAEHDSAIRISTPNVYFPDSIGCGDWESSFVNEGATTGPVSCTDFNW